MTTFLLIVMALLLVAALERTHRRQPTQPPGLHGARDHHDRDWARTQSDLLVLGGQSDFRHQQSQRSSRPNAGRLEIQARMRTRSNQRIAGISSN